jgi:poly-gamma-glutamate capsule biosynthesis protein CapA/YwtB (metallophosphatase superfamily)
MPRLRFLSLLVILTLLNACQAPMRLYATDIPPSPVLDMPTTVPVASTIVPTDTPTPFHPIPPTFTVTPLPSPTITPTPTATPLPVITLLFTGVIVPARCVQAAIDERGSTDYIYAEVQEQIQQADLAIGTLNATLSDSTQRTGCVPTYTLVGSSNNADALAAAGFDIMSVATNHIKNGGDQAFLDTLENLRRVGIAPVGAGANLEEALKPLVISVKGIRFGIVSLGMVEPMAFAGPDTPGIAILTNENLQAAISAARQVSDVVIVMPHWGPEDTPNPNSYQLDFAQAAVEAGADLVMGNHTHVVQAVQVIDGITVFYGLGNFVFDQTWDLAHQQGVILRVTFEGKTMVGYEFIPTHVDGDGTVHIADTEEAAQVLDRIQVASDLLK